MSDDGFGDDVENGMPPPPFLLLCLHQERRHVVFSLMKPRP